MTNEYIQFQKRFPEVDTRPSCEGWNSATSTGAVVNVSSLDQWGYQVKTKIRKVCRICAEASLTTMCMQVCMDMHKCTRIAVCVGMCVNVYGAYVRASIRLFSLCLFKYMYHYVSLVFGRRYGLANTAARGGPATENQGAIT